MVDNLVFFLDGQNYLYFSMVLVAQWYTVRTLIFNSTSVGNDESRGISLVSLAFCRHLIKQQSWTN